MLVFLKILVEGTVSLFNGGMRLSIGHILQALLVSRNTGPCYASLSALRIGLWGFSKIEDGLVVFRPSEAGSVIVRIVPG